MHATRLPHRPKGGFSPGSPVSLLNSARYDCFFRYLNDFGRCFWQGLATRNTLSTSAFYSYSKSLQLMARKWNDSAQTHGFPKPRPLVHSFRGDVIDSKSHSKNGRYRREERELDSDAETESEDEEDLIGKSWKSKKGSGKSRKLKSQKSAGNITLSPSRYLFKDFLPGHGEVKRWERRYASEHRKGKANWYSRQMLRLTQEGKMHNQMDYNNIVCPSSSRSKCEENPKLKWADKLAHYKHNC